VVAAAGENLTPLTLELGGKSPNLVFADADLDASARFATEYGLVARSGQGCLLPTRTLVQRSVYEQFVERVVTAADAVVVGDPFEAATAMGPVISEQACDRILGMIQTAVSEKMGRLVAGGDRLGGPLADGYYLQPTVFADVDPTSPLAKEEIFGPVLSIMPFDTEDEAVEMANDSVYGLAAYLSTSDLNRVQRLFPRLAAGSVYVNGHPGMIPSIPVGGHRQSGWGREGGKDGLEDFLQVKNVFIAGP
jgi:acyl-CoA reductase-like NAD-dependent aldehyde dehydrogenase